MRELLIIQDKSRRHQLSLEHSFGDSLPIGYSTHKGSVHRHEGQVEEQGLGRIVLLYDCLRLLEGQQGCGSG